jgi:mono/diheme cytochrome c family protein
LRIERPIDATRRRHELVAAAGTRRCAFADLLRAIAIVSLAGIACAAAADARQDYILNCMGCHLVDGAGKPPSIPRLADRVGYYLTIPQGRAYLAQVPGAANSLLTDAQLAAVLNWVVAEFAGASMPARFEPYETTEVGTYRDARPADVDALRHALHEEISRRYPNTGAW